MGRPHEVESFLALPLASYDDLSRGSEPLHNLSRQRVRVAVSQKESTVLFVEPVPPSVGCVLGLSQQVVDDLGVDAYVGCNLCH